MLAQTNKLTEAMEDIEKARMKGRELKDEFVEFICLLNKAYLYLQERYESSAVELIREGMSLGRIKGFVNPFMFPKEALRAVVSKAFEQGIEENYVRGLTRKNNLLPDISRLDDRRWPWPFKIFTFGRFSVLKDNESCDVRCRTMPVTWRCEMLDRRNRKKTVNAWLVTWEWLNPELRIARPVIAMPAPILCTP